MAKISFRQFIVQYWIHTIVLVFLVGFGIRQTLLYFAAADNCITPEQWTTMSQDQTHCYVQYNRNGVLEVWQPAKDQNGWTHHGNSICGTDITSIIPASHLADPNKYLNIGARYVGTMGSCVQPTATTEPTAVPSDTPVPSPTTAAQNPTPTDVPQPTATTAPGAPTSTPTPIPSATPTLVSGVPTPTTIPSAMPTSSQEQANIDIVSPTSMLSPTPTLKVVSMGVTPIPTSQKAHIATLVMASQFSADASIGLALAVMGLAIYFKIKTKKPAVKSSAPTTPPPATDIYKVSLSYKSPDGKFDWVNLDDGKKIIEGLYGGTQPCPEGQCHVTGVMKIYPPDKPYLEITIITPIKT